MMSYGVMQRDADAAEGHHVFVWTGKLYSKNTTLNVGSKSDLEKVLGHCAQYGEERPTHIYILHEDQLREVDLDFKPQPFGSEDYNFFTSKIKLKCTETELGTLKIQVEGAA
jgi:hypothetical protein